MRKTGKNSRKMVTGRIEKYYKEICLLEQPFIKDTDITVQEHDRKIAKIGKTSPSGVSPGMSWAKELKRTR